MNGNRNQHLIPEPLAHWMCEFILAVPATEETDAACRAACEIAGISNEPSIWEAIQNAANGYRRSRQRTGPAGPIKSSDR